MSSRPFMYTLLALILFVSSYFSVKAFAADKSDYSNDVDVVVISDIDDTIESSHIRGNPLRIFGHAVNYHDAFLGMSLLYQALAKNGARVLYVSGMPVIVDKVIQGATEFLRANSFPGNYILRDSMREDTYTFKVRTISAYLAALQEGHPNKKIHVIAPGDNGEQDIRVLDTISKIFPDVTFDIYIHKLYENGVLKILPVQVPFYTAADLAVQIYNSSINQSGVILEQAQMAKVFESVQYGLSDSDPDTRALVVPKWAELTFEDQQKIRSIMSKTPFQLKRMGERLARSVDARIEEIWDDGGTQFYQHQINE